MSRPFIRSAFACPRFPYVAHWSSGARRGRVPSPAFLNGQSQSKVGSDTQRRIHPVRHAMTARRPPSDRVTDFDRRPRWVTLRPETRVSSAAGQGCRARPATVGGSARAADREGRSGHFLVLEAGLARAWQIQRLIDGIRESLGPGEMYRNLLAPHRGHDPGATSCCFLDGGRRLPVHAAGIAEGAGTSGGSRPFRFPSVFGALSTLPRSNDADKRTHVSFFTAVSRGKQPRNICSTKLAASRSIADSRHLAEARHVGKRGFSARRGFRSVSLSTSGPLLRPAGARCCRSGLARLHTTARPKATSSDCARHSFFNAESRPKIFGFAGGHSRKKAAPSINEIRTERIVSGRQSIKPMRTVRGGRGADGARTILGQHAKAFWGYDSAIRSIRRVYETRDPPGRAGDHLTGPPGDVVRMPEVPSSCGAARLAGFFIFYYRTMVGFRLDYRTRRTESAGEGNIARESPLGRNGLFDHTRPPVRRHALRNGNAVISKRPGFALRN